MDTHQHDLDLERTPFAFVDVETTGLRPHQGHRVCEVAVVRTVGRVETRRFCSLVNPNRPIGAGARAVNGITDRMVARAPRFEQLLDDVLPLLKGAVVVAHNVPFDMGFLNHELWLAGAPQLPNSTVDTLAITRRAYGFPSNSLAALCSRLGLVTVPHRALGDTLAVKNLLWWLVDDLRPQGIATLGHLLALESTGLEPSAPQEALPDELVEAMRRGGTVHLRYQASDGCVTERRVAPKRVDHRYGRHYLVAYCYLRRAERSFRLDRILELSPEQTE
jgi:DNA polymerase-3 subunit epsilon